MTTNTLTDATTDRAQTALDRDAGEFHDALSAFLRVYQFRDRDRICCHDISVTQAYALDAVARKGPSTLNAIAAELYLEKSTASRVVKGLEAKGYLERSRNPADGRSVLLDLTPAGRELRGRIEADLLEEEKDVLEDFDSEVRRAMTDLIGRLTRAAAARVDTSGGSCCRIE